MSQFDSSYAAREARRQCFGDPARLASVPSLDRAQELDQMSIDANANANQAQQGQAPQQGQQATQANPTTPGQSQQVPGGQGQAQQAQQGQGQAGQLSDQQAEQAARYLIQNHPQLIAPALTGQGQGQGQGAPAGAGAAPSAGDLMAHLPQAIMFVRAFLAALQAAGVSIPGL